MAAFFQNSIGFLIQFFPCALMIFLPFPQESLRFRRKTVIIWLSVISAITALIFSAMLLLRDPVMHPRHIVFSNTFMSAAIILVFIAYICIVRESTIKKLMVFFIVLFYAETEFVTVNILHAFLFPNIPDTTLYPYNFRFLVLYAATTALLLPLTLAIVIRPLKEYIQMIDPRNMKHEFVIEIISTLVYLFLTIYCDTLYGKIVHSLVYIPLLLFLTLNQLLIYWLIFRESVRRKRDNEHSRAIEIMHLQYEKIVGDMENTRRMRHDLRHHYNILNDMFERGHKNEIRDYLSNLIDATVKTDNEVYCKNMTVNGLLCYYTSLARDEGIRCNVQAECGELNIEPSDLTVMFGNAMENAVKACGKCPDDKWINIKIGTVMNSLAIEISNSCKGVRIAQYFMTEDGFLPAEAFLSGRSGVGYGLRSIAHTAQKYGGSALFRFNGEKEMFTTRIRLNIQPDG